VKRAERPVTVLSAAAAANLALKKQKESQPVPSGFGCLGIGLGFRISAWPSQYGDQPYHGYLWLRSWPWRPSAKYLSWRRHGGPASGKLNEAGH